MGKVADSIQKMIDNAVAEEREACAKIADQFCYPPNDVGRLDGLGDEAEEIAAAIRARGKQHELPTMR